MSGKGPVRGFPPVPGQPAPLYPPGQFAAWNRMSAARGGPTGAGAGHPAGGRPGDAAVAGAYEDGGPHGGGHAAAGYGAGGYGAGGYGAEAYGAEAYGAEAYGPGDEAYEPGYSALAVSDPAADVTSTQTWQVMSDSPDGPGAWTSPRRSAADAAGPPAGTGTAGTGTAGTGTAEPDGAETDAAGMTALADGRTGGGSPAQAGPGRSGTRAAGSRAAGSRAAGSRAAGSAAAGSGAAGSRAGARGGRSGRSRRSGRPFSAVLAVCAVVVVAIAAGAFLLHAAEHQSTPPTADRSAAAPSTASASPSPTLGPFGHIASRAADPLPLTVAQLFPDAFTVGGAAFTRTTSEPKANCASAVIGTALQAAVPAGTCSQVVRASYLAASEQAMGTIGVLNLSTAATAAHAGHAANKTDFIGQLKGPSGPTRALGQGAGLEEAATKGHYLILIWAQLVSRASPKSPAQQALLKNFMTQLFDETANVSLSNRMVSGTP
jgi:hypothetical protein